MVKDRFNREIKVGDIITYPVKHSCSVNMSIALVIEIVSFEDREWNFLNKCYEPCIGYKLKCRRFNDDYWSNDKGKFGKTVIVSNPNQMIIDRFILPFEYQETLGQGGY